MKIKLFVDDIRPAMPGWSRARTITEAIRILATSAVDVVSLDHDIACHGGGTEHSSQETFEPVAWYIKSAYINEDDAMSRPDVWFHTGNHAAGRRMADIMGVTYNPKK